jgi:hypothetical protein
LTALSSTEAAARAPGAKTQKIPESLVDVGEFGENVYDLVKADGWAKATEKFDALKVAAKKLAGDIKIAKADHKRLDETLAALGKALGAKDKLPALRAANQVTLIAADLSEPLGPQVPAAVARLDFYGRELELGAAAKDMDQLKAAVVGLRKNWDKVRAAAKAKGGDAEAKRFDALMVRLEAAKSVAEHAKLATPILDEVDNLEKVFKN